MSDVSDTQTMKSTPAMNGDELDVLEALLRMEISSNKKILNDEQRAKLLLARQQLKKIHKSKSTVSGEKSLTGDVFVLAMRKAVEDLLLDWYEYCPRDEWEAKDDLVKSKVINLFFYLIYGVREDEIKLKIDSISTTNLIDKNDSPSPTDEELALRSFKIVQSLLQSTEDYRSKYYDDLVWVGYSTDEKKFAREQMFQKVFGVSAKDFGYNLFQQMKGWL